jgi:hypothetical protein
MGTTCFDIPKLCIVPTQCIHVLHMVLTVNSINRLGFVTETGCPYNDIGTIFVNTVYSNLRFERVNWSEFHPVCRRSSERCVHSGRKHVTSAEWCLLSLTKLLARRGHPGSVQKFRTCVSVGVWSGLVWSGERDAHKAALPLSRYDM